MQLLPLLLLSALACSRNEAWTVPLAGKSCRRTGVRLRDSRDGLRRGAVATVVTEIARPRQQTALFAFPGSNAVALDRSAIPRGFTGLFKDIGNGNGSVNGWLVALLSIAVIMKLLPRKEADRNGGSSSSSSSSGRAIVPSSDVDDEADSLFWTSRLENVVEVIKRPLVKALVFTRLCVRVLIAKLTLLLGRFLSTLVRTFDLYPAEELDIKDWKVCVLDERESLAGGIVRYRFELPNPSAIIPLYVGQELSMCSIDSRDRVLKESFFPISSSNARGFFDVLVRRGGSESTPFTKTLETLALGDELAFKGGRYRLNYQGQDDPISSMTVVASGLGVSPTLQILRGILADRESSVEDVELLWLNENSDDFVCEDDVESLELRHIEKLVVTRVIENDIYGRDLMKNEQIQDAVSPYEEGRVAIICAPDYITSSLRQLFQDLGYPTENILSIV